MNNQYCLEVRAEMACFTRPEMKVERVSYDIITPSAARAVFESILWKPAIAWRVLKIEVLKPVRWISVRRNEVASVISVRNVQTAMKAGQGNLGLYAEEDRQQRAGLLLYDVAYRLHAQFSMQPDCGENNYPDKFHDMFVRRASRGQCINQPYLGCREFACDFRLIEPGQAQTPPLAHSADLGWMLYDIDFSNPAKPKPHFFRAQLREGVLDLSHIGGRP